MLYSNMGSEMTFSRIFLGGRLWGHRIRYPMEVGLKNICLLSIAKFIIRTKISAIHQNTFCKCQSLMIVSLIFVGSIAVRAVLQVLSKCPWHHRAGVSPLCDELYSSGPSDHLVLCINTEPDIRGPEPANVDQTKALVLSSYVLKRFP